MKPALPSFASDNHSGVHPELMAAILECNSASAPSYGTDAWSAELEEKWKQIFGPKSESYLVFNGTAANILCLKALVQSHQAVLASDHSHLHLDECGAPEANIGCKLIVLPAFNGKISAEQIQNAIIRRGDQHFAQIKAVSITQPTELGTVYSLSELAAIRHVCDENGLFLHVDGARLIYAAHFLKVDLKTAAGGADAISLGGTKNGLLLGEAVILSQPHPEMKYLRKQSLQLPSKTRFIANQFLRWLKPSESDQPLWAEIAGHGHQLALKLREQVQNISGVEITQATQANSVFARIPPPWLKPLREHFFFYVWDEKTYEVRWMMSFDHTEDDVDAFASLLHQLSRG